MVGSRSSSALLAINKARIFSNSVRHGSFKNVKILNPSAAYIQETFSGEEAAKKPIKVQLEAGKTYSFCTCGLSSRQPWCDGSDHQLGRTMRRSIDFTVDKTGDYVLCMCKQSKKMPICDGTHKTISQRPKSEDANLLFAVADDDAVYQGVARKLGYRTKGPGWQK
ncbi:iron-binding zinc finger CDGSH type domain-containing protein [Ditylenchus destructor]|uniref:Iron-binding zinc finger CDGSH type domain-containing protein n=1 Tax=Ditylenchus destructor TaxID=166010 RepID=A0AAD4NA37_9BILA|nr:iron-binding zinc finger CDGSH type domain-containing protein [Ditylenchus destructor]